MNTLDLRAEPIIGGYAAIYRRIHKAAHEAVLERGRPKVFQTEADALKAAWNALRPHVEHTMRRDGEKLGEAWARVRRQNRRP